MKMMMTSSPVTSVSLSDLGTSFLSLPMSTVLPNETVDVKTTAEAEAAFQEYTDRVKATGKPAVLVFFKAPRETARKPVGFNKAAKKQRYVNLKAAKVDDRRTNKPAETQEAA